MYFLYSCPSFNDTSEIANNWDLFAPRESKAPHFIKLSIKTEKQLNQVHNCYLCNKETMYRNLYFYVDEKFNYSLNYFIVLLSPLVNFKSE